jgi:hypothetical protein
MKFASRLAAIAAAAVFGALTFTATALAAENPQPAPVPEDRQPAPVPEDPLGDFKPLSEIEIDYLIEDEELPVDASKNLFAPPEPYSRGAMGRETWPELEFSWEVSELLYQPLYFDDAPLERYGLTCCRILQPATSAAHFFGTTLLMPSALFRCPMRASISG